MRKSQCFAVSLLQDGRKVYRKENENKIFHSRSRADLFLPKKNVMRHKHFIFNQKTISVEESTLKCGGVFVSAYFLSMKKADQVELKQNADVTCVFSCYAWPVLSPQFRSRESSKSTR